MDNSNYTIKGGSVPEGTYVRILPEGTYVLINTINPIYIVWINWSGAGAPRGENIELVLGTNTMILVLMILCIFSHSLKS